MIPLKKNYFIFRLCFLFYLVGTISTQPLFASDSFTGSNILFDDKEIIGGTINIYKQVRSIEPCLNELIVENNTGLHIGDTIALIQMKGADINRSNSAQFGNISSFNNAGSYEFNYIKDIVGTRIVLKNALLNKYDYEEGAVQLIRVPYFKKAVEVRSELTCMPWNGTVGGVLIFLSREEVTLFANINVSGKGYSGGKGKNRNYNFVTCFANDFVRGPNNNAAQKGESFAHIPDNLNYGKGKIGSGGGGGLDHNSGGGGGGNGGPGGSGGYQLDECGNSPFDNRGLGGTALDSSVYVNRVFMGGGGGAGDGNNPPGFISDGGNGGGIIIIQAKQLLSNNYSILANGTNGADCTPDNQFGKCHEGMGGGGAGGTVFLDIINFADKPTISAAGGNGANMNGGRYGRLGPGGGGGGGVISISIIPENIQTILAGGANGVNTDYSNHPWGATPGSPGKLWQQLKLVYSTIPFVVDEPLNISSSLIACREVAFVSNILTPSGKEILWNFGDGKHDDNPITRYKYPTPGNYLIKLLTENSSGCTDSAFTEIYIPDLQIEKLNDLEICENSEFEIRANAEGQGLSYLWHTSQNIVDAEKSTVQGKAVSSELLKLDVKDAYGCIQSDSMYLTVRKVIEFKQPPPQYHCEGDSLQLISGNDQQLLHRWSPEAIFDQVDSPAPKILLQTSQTLNLNLRDDFCGIDTIFNVHIDVKKNPSVELNSSNDIDCDITYARLTASGAQQYFYHNVDSIYGSGNSHAVVYPREDRYYRVTGVDAYGCAGNDSVLVKVLQGSFKTFTLPNAFTPNNDGKNDCFGISHWGATDLKEFSIFNRWGEKIFSTTNPSKCWDGTYKGQKQNEGGYVYIIHIRRPCGDIQKKGIFYLIR